MEYVFHATQYKNEWERLQAIESVFDPASRRRILSAGVKEGARCLEVGAGAGSVMRWLAEKVGPSGRVTAVDINTRFLDTPPANVDVVAGDIRALVFESNSFDLVHARYVLVHIPEYKMVLDSLWKALKPGGALVVEEPDFTAYRGFSGAEVQSFNKVHQAIVDMYSSKGVDPSLGSKLPMLFQGLGAKDLVIENDSPFSCGGSGISTMMNLSAVQLKEKYLATGKVTGSDLEAYSRFTQNSDSWAIYYATIGAIGQK
ncbi:MAG: methyltransferase domain-containing protein [Elusimicrobia bacterium]|nr:methyltransferase domain-containing protein [Elusimicrobiota bacterium]